MCRRACRAQTQAFYRSTAAWHPAGSTFPRLSITGAGLKSGLLCLHHTDVGITVAKAVFRLPNQACWLWKGLSASVVLISNPSTLTSSTAL